MISSTTLCPFSTLFPLFATIFVPNPLKKNGLGTKDFRYNRGYNSSCKFLFMYLFFDLNNYDYPLIRANFNVIHKKWKIEPRITQIITN